MKWEGKCACVCVRVCVSVCVCVLTLEECACVCLRECVDFDQSVCVCSLVFACSMEKEIVKLRKGGEGMRNERENEREKEIAELL